jgi:hypothetical protein
LFTKQKAKVSRPWLLILRIFILIHAYSLTTILSSFIQEKKRFLALISKMAGAAGAKGLV